MFESPRPLRAATPWQSSARLVPEREVPSFASTRWREAAGPEFQDAGMPAHADGFNADRYEPMTQPLSPSALKAWALLNDEYADEALGEAQGELQDNVSPNAHLPFVPDVYRPIPTKARTLRGKPVDDETRTAPEHDDVGADEHADAQAHDEAHQDAHDEAATQAPAQLEHAQSDDAMLAADAAIDHADIDEDEAFEHDEMAQAADDSEATAAADEAVAETDELTETPGVEPVSEVAIEPELSESALTASEEDPVADTAPQALAADPDEVSVAADAVTPEPVVVGIDPEEVAQREALQFAQGVEEGERRAREAMAHEVAAQCAVLAQVADNLNALLQERQQFFEPMKRLSLHLAEQLVLGELSTSSQAIERLVQRCLDEVSHPIEGGVVVELNPADKVRLQAQAQTQGGDWLKGMRLESVSTLKPGSVRVLANHMVVDDLVEHRLNALAKTLLSDVGAWQAHSALAQPESDEDTHDLESDDDHS